LSTIAPLFNPVRFQPPFFVVRFFLTGSEFDLMEAFAGRVAMCKTTDGVGEMIELASKLQPEQALPVLRAAETVACGLVDRLRKTIALLEKAQATRAAENTQGNA
jgi:hypothetical protein